MDPQNPQNPNQIPESPITPVPHTPEPLAPTWSEQTPTNPAPTGTPTSEAPQSETQSRYVVEEAPQTEEREESVETPPGAPVESSQKTNWLAILLGILFVLALSGMGYFAFQNFQLKQQIADLESQTPPTPVPTEAPTPSPTPDITTNWKTYTNNAYGFSIKYPSDKYVQLICPAEEKDFFYLTKRENQTADSINMPSCARDSRYNLEIKTSDKSFAEPKTNEFATVTKETTTVGGVAAARYVSKKTGVTSPTPSWYTEVILNYKNKYYDLYFDEEASVNVFDQILSTFKFVGASPSASPTASPTPTPKP